MLTHKVLTNNHPGYLSELIVEQQSSSHTTDENKDCLQGFHGVCANLMEQSYTFTAMIHNNHFHLP